MCALTAGLALWVQSGDCLLAQYKILWVNAIFECKFDSFPKSVLSPNCLTFPTLSGAHYNTGSKKKRSNLVLTLQDVNDTIECFRVFIRYTWPRIWTILMPSPTDSNSFVSTTVLYTKSYITLGWHVEKRTLSVCHSYWVMSVCWEYALPWEIFFF